ncbi:glycosyltransferase family 2 protein [candidate division TA06 bacterium]|uniref:Glycosyltransferase family 2 protein n=1 Tax=candidate division TA06 bacterium TaxID=2250710 RepID=A0A933ML78_UNCT6|nr:glycosyltransferase family 2 protein [candidate division TA06 bacterium]
MPVKVAIIIPHHNGQKLLENCLSSLFQTEYPDYKVYLADNASSDGSPQWAKKNYPQIEIIKADKNLGYAGGCNLGIRSTTEDYVVLLNNDTEVKPDWLGRLVSTMDEDGTIAAAQPKILWLKDRTQFDYSGGAGGLMDVYGYPYCRGRMFEEKEKDRGQYDRHPADIFWASGSASIYRRTALDVAGLLDEDFFMHMEEIDLAWRLHLLGWRVISVPGSVIFHLSGGSLPTGNFRKMYLNHRNSQLMMWKNYSLASLLRIWPGRMLLEAAAFAKAVISGNWEWARAIVLAGWWLLENPLTIWKKHRQVQTIRKVSDRRIREKMFPGSMALEYFIKHKRTAQQLEGKR